MGNHPFAHQSKPPTKGGIRHGFHYASKDPPNTQIPFPTVPHRSPTVTLTVLLDMKPPNPPPPPPQPFWTQNPQRAAPPFARRCVLDTKPTSSAAFGPRGGGVPRLRGAAAPRGADESRGRADGAALVRGAAAAGPGGRGTPGGGGGVSKGG